MSPTTAMPTSAPKPAKITPLPQEVINRIAAGEVVQRPASIAKELIENSLDADASCIDIASLNGGMSLLTVTDDGYGIHPQDLSLAATRFATSKLTHFDDLKHIQTFGFRGEALASASMVSKLTITSRRRLDLLKAEVEEESNATAKSNKSKSFSLSCAYRQTYKDGTPCSASPKPSAGNMGTVIKIQDLFYNVPNRKRAFHGAKKESEEYHKILHVVQRYAIHCAKKGVAFTCRKKAGHADLNTQSLPLIKIIQEDKKKKINKNNKDKNILQEEETQLNACKETIAHIFGSNVAQELLSLDKTKGDLLTEARNGVSHQNGNGNDKHDPVFTYSAKALFTNPSYTPPRSASTFILFINHRLVEFPSLKRALESIYAETLSRGAKPFVYLDLELPGWHIDVNVHPTKREVAYLFEEELIENLVQEVKRALGGASGSKVFQAKSLVPIVKNVVDLDKESASLMTSQQGSRSNNMREKIKKLVKDSCSSEDDSDTDSDDDHDDNNEDGVMEGENDYKEQDSQMSHSRKRRTPISTPPSSAQKKRSVDPKKLIRTNIAAPAGALEPFLVPTQSQSQTQSLTPSQSRTQPRFLLQSQSSSQPSLSQSSEEIDLSSHHSDDNKDAANVAIEQPFQHDPSCPQYNNNDGLDMSMPGAFASMCKCQIKNPGKTLGTSQLTQPNKVIRPKKVQTSPCELTSVQMMRCHITNDAHSVLTTKLRESTFVGIVSRQWCLIQWGIELLMINHYNLSKLLFYQLTIWRFGDIELARFAKPVNVKAVIQDALDFDESSQETKEGEIGPSSLQQQEETNSDLSEQATRCLSEHVKMLNDYFSIEFEILHGELYLTGLPILLENHAPQPHALPLFLLRLATEVNWEDEEECFEGICREIGSFYAEIPCRDPAVTRETSTSKGNGKDKISEAFVKHTLFPALSFLLVPNQNVATDGRAMKIATVPALYKVFERC